MKPLLTYQFGWGLRAPFRALLEQLKFMGDLQDYLETRVWGGSVFLLKGVSPVAEYNADIFLQRVRAKELQAEAAAAARKAQEVAKAEAAQEAFDAFCRKAWPWVSVGIVAAFLGLGLWAN